MCHHTFSMILYFYIPISIHFIYNFFVFYSFHLFYFFFLYISLLLSRSPTLYRWVIKTAHWGFLIIALYDPPWVLSVDYGRYLRCDKTLSEEKRNKKDKSLILHAFFYLFIFYLLAIFVYIFLVVDIHQDYMRLLWKESEIWSIQIFK